MTPLETTALETAQEHWDPVPDWIESLAIACMETSQAKAAAKIERSPSVVSQVLRNRYKGNLSGIEERVRGAFLAAVIDCPAVGELSLLDCSKWREHAKAPSLHNPTRRMMAKSCRHCHFFKTKDN